MFVFFGVTFLRGFLEGIFEESHVIGFRLEAAQSVEMVLLHGPLFYLTVFALAAFVLSWLARAPVDRTARAALAFSPVILVAPLLDAIVSPHGFGLHYFANMAEAGRGLALTFDPRVALAGVSPGMRLEVLLACIGGAIYIRARRGGLLLPAVAFISVYAVAWFAGALPALFTLAVRGNVPESTIFAAGGLVFSETRKYALVQLPVATLGVLLCYAKSRRGKLGQSLAASRPLRSLFYAAVTALGLVMGAAFLRPYYSGFLSDPFAGLGCAAAVLAIYFLFQFQVILNDYFDRQVDQALAKRTHFTGDPLTGAQAAFIGTASLGLSIAFAAAIGYAALVILLTALAAGIAYSAPPMRLKRFFLVNTFVLSLGVLLAASLGFSLFAGRHTIAAFPHGVAGAMIVGFTLALGVKDVPDYVGDTQAGIRTIVTVFGPLRGRQILAAAFLVMYVAVPLLVRYPLLLFVCVPCGIVSALGVLRWGERVVFAAFFAFAIAMGVLMWQGRVLGGEDLSSGREPLGKGIGAYLEGVSPVPGEALEGQAAALGRFVSGAPPAMAYLLPGALTSLGRLELGQGRAPEAYQNLNRAASAPSYPEEAAVYAAAAGLEIDRSTEVLEALDQAVSLHPQSARLRIARARVLIDRAPARAMPDLAFAYRCGYDLAVTCGYLGDVERLIGQPERAEAFYHEALAVEPNSLPALAGLAELALARGAAGPAAAAIDRLVRVLNSQGRREEAAAWKQRAARRDASQ